MDNLASLCTREVVGIDAGASLQRAAALMYEQHVGALVVVTGEQPPQVVGIVTDRDLALEGLAAGGATQLVGALAKSPPLAVPGSASLREAVRAMEEAGVRRLLVVDDDGGVVGIVSSDDLLHAVSAELESLAAALRKNIERERSRERPAPAAPAPMRPVFPAFGTAAAH